MYQQHIFYETKKISLIASLTGKGIFSNKRLDSDLIVECAKKHLQDILEDITDDFTVLFDYFNVRCSYPTTQSEQINPAATFSFETSGSEILIDYPQLIVYDPIIPSYLRFERHYLVDMFNTCVKTNDLCFNARDFITKIRSQQPQSTHLNIKLADLDILFNRDTYYVTHQSLPNVETYDQMKHRVKQWDPFNKKHEFKHHKDELKLFSTMARSFLETFQLSVKRDGHGHHVFHYCDGKVDRHVRVPAIVGLIICSKFISEPIRNPKMWHINQMMLDLIDLGVINNWDDFFDRHPMRGGSWKKQGQPLIQKSLELHKDIGNVIGAWLVATYKGNAKCLYKRTNISSDNPAEYMNWSVKLTRHLMQRIEDSKPFERMINTPYQEYLLTLPSYLTVSECGLVADGTSTRFEADIQLYLNKNRFTNGLISLDGDVQESIDYNNRITHVKTHTSDQLQNQLQGKPLKGYTDPIVACLDYLSINVETWLNDIVAKAETYSEQLTDLMTTHQLKNLDELIAALGNRQSPPNIAYTLALISHMYGHNIQLISISDKLEKEFVIVDGFGNDHDSKVTHDNKPTITLHWYKHNNQHIHDTQSTVCFFVPLR